MAQPVHVAVGTDGTTYSQCLHYEGFPAVLWDTLHSFGYQSPPVYAGRAYQDHGIPRSRVHVRVPPPPDQPQWPLLEVVAEGHMLHDTWEFAALQTLTQFCRAHPLEIVLDPIGLFPARDTRDPDWLDRMEHMDLLGLMDPQRTIFVSARCLNVFYRMVELQSRAMAMVIGMAVAN